MIVDLRKDASMEDINAYIRQSHLGFANSLIYKATFRYMLLPRAYSRQQFLEMASLSAIAGARVDASAISLEVTLEKRNDLLRAVKVGARFVDGHNGYSSPSTML